MTQEPAQLGSGASGTGDSRSGPPDVAHRAFEEQVRRAPGAVALVCGPERLSYAELDARRPWAHAASHSGSHNRPSAGAWRENTARTLVHGHVSRSGSTISSPAVTTTLQATVLDRCSRSWKSSERPESLALTPLQVYRSLYSLCGCRGVGRLHRQRGA